MKSSLGISRTILSSSILISMITGCVSIYFVSDRWSPIIQAFRVIVWATRTGFSLSPFIPLLYKRHSACFGYSLCCCSLLHTLTLSMIVCCLPSFMPLSFAWILNRCKDENYTLLWCMCAFRRWYSSMQKDKYLHDRFVYRYHFCPCIMHSCR
jgi:hypothetical protein